MSMHIKHKHVSSWIKWCHTHNSLIFSRVLSATDSAFPLFHVMVRDSSEGLLSNRTPNGQCDLLQKHQKDKLTRQRSRNVRLSKNPAIFCWINKCIYCNKQIHPSTSKQEPPCYIVIWNSHFGLCYATFIIFTSNPLDTDLLTLLLTCRDHCAFTWYMVSRLEKQRAGVIHPKHLSTQSGSVQKSWWKLPKSHPNHLWIPNTKTHLHVFEENEIEHLGENAKHCKTIQLRKYRTGSFEHSLSINGRNSYVRRLSVDQFVKETHHGPMPMHLSLYLL